MKVTAKHTEWKLVSSITALVQNIRRNSMSKWHQLFLKVFIALVYLVILGERFECIWNFPFGEPSLFLLSKQKVSWVEPVALPVTLFLSKGMGLKFNELEHLERHLRVSRFGEFFLLCSSLWRRPWSSSLPLAHVVDVNRPCCSGVLLVQHENAAYRTASKVSWHTYSWRQWLLLAQRLSTCWICSSPSWMTALVLFSLASLLHGFYRWCQDNGEGLLRVIYCSP